MMLRIPRQCVGREKSYPNCATGLYLASVRVILNLFGSKNKRLGLHLNVATTDYQ